MSIDAIDVAIDVVNNRGTFGFSLEKFRTSLAIFGNF